MLADMKLACLVLGDHGDVAGSDGTDRPGFDRSGVQYSLCTKRSWSEGQGPRRRPNRRPRGRSTDRQEWGPWLCTEPEPPAHLPSASLARPDRRSSSLRANPHRGLRASGFRKECPPHAFFDDLGASKLHSGILRGRSESLGGESW